MIPDLSVAWVIFFVLLLVGILNRLLFAPVLRVMVEREGAIRSARELALGSASRAEAASAEYEARTGAARAEVYKDMDETRRVALERRQQSLAATRREAEAAVAAARDSLRAESEQARAALTADADRLGAAIVERVLGRTVS